MGIKYFILKPVAGVEKTKKELPLMKSDSSFTCQDGPAKQAFFCRGGCSTDTRKRLPLYSQQFFSYFKHISRAHGDQKISGFAVLQQIVFNLIKSGEIFAEVPGFFRIRSMRSPEEIPRVSVSLAA